MLRVKLEKAGLDLNDTLQLQPKIDVREPESKLLEQLKKASKLVTDNDDLKEVTYEVLDKIDDLEVDDIVRTEKQEEKRKNIEEIKEKRDGSEAEPGVVQTIVNEIERSGSIGVTKKEIMEVLKDRFPNRDEDSMATTLDCQLPWRISKERFEVVKEKRYIKKEFLDKEE